MILKGNILYKYPGQGTKIFTLGNEDDQFYLCPFSEKESRVFSGEVHDYDSQEIPIYFSDQFPVCSSKKDYLLQFSKYLDAFRTKGISKAILSRIKKQQVKDVDLTSVFNKMCQLYPSAFCYVFSIEGIGTWAGASPELLLKYKDNSIHTVALAGTKYSADPEVWTEKEKVEHGLVEEYIKALASKKHPLVKETKPQVVQAGKLYHLKSTFEFHSEKEDISSFLHRIHPTPAICGLPFEKSKELIESTENHDREYYCGYIGIVPRDSSDFRMYVNIRCMQIIKNDAFLYIGGGITKDSQGEMEWEETERKSETMGKIWG